MINNGKVNESVFDRSIRKIINSAKGVPEQKLQTDRWHGAFDMGGNRIVITQASETGSDRQIGAAVVCQAVNRLAAQGSQAECVMIQIILPGGCEERILKQTVRSASDMCMQLSVAIGQCEAQAVDDLKEMIVTASAIGQANSIFQSGQAKAGQDLIMTGWAGLRGAVKLTEKNTEKLSAHFNRAFLDPLDNCDPMSFSVLNAVKSAGSVGVHAMQASGEGGIFGAVWAMAQRDDLGARIRLKDILLRQEIVEVCDYLGMTPYQLLNTGTLLMAADHGQKVLDAMAAAGIPAVIIGHLTNDHDRVVINDDEVRFLEPFRQDSLDDAK